MTFLKDYIAYLGRVQDRMAIGMAGCVGFMVSIPSAFVIVYGVGFRNWSPVWMAFVMLGIPMAVTAAAYKLIQWRNRGQG